MVEVLDNLVLSLAPSGPVAVIAGVLLVFLIVTTITREKRAAHHEENLNKILSNFSEQQALSTQALQNVVLQLTNLHDEQIKFCASATSKQNEMLKVIEETKSKVEELHYDVVELKHTVK